MPMELAQRIFLNLVHGQPLGAGIDDERQQRPDQQLFLVSVLREIALA